MSQSELICAELRERLASFELSKLAVWVGSTTHWGILWANGPALELWAADSLEELIARDFSDTPEKTTKQLSMWMQTLVEGKERYVRFDRTVFPRGQPVQVTAYASELELANGELAFLYQAVVRDVPFGPSVIRNAEAVRHSPVMVALLSFGGEVLSRNPAAADAFGLDSPVSEWFGEHELVDQILAGPKRNEIYRNEVMIRHTQGARVCALEARRTLDPVSGEPTVLLHLLDQTELRDAEQEARALSEALATVKRQREQLRQSQKMQALGTVASGVAHDFNNLLAIIKGACELAQLEIPSEDASHEFFSEIAAAAERGAGLTRQLLTFSRRDRDAVVGRIELNAMIVELSQLLTRLIDQRIRLELDLDEQECWVEGNADQLGQVIMNLGINARDAMPGGGHLRIATRRRASPPQVLLEVSDTGVGMSEELQAKIFEPFFTTKDPGKGTGLGLSMVLRIIEDNGGELHLDSVVGRGTRFEIGFPLASSMGD